MGDEYDEYDEYDAFYTIYPFVIFRHLSSPLVTVLHFAFCIFPKPP